MRSLPSRVLRYCTRRFALLFYGKVVTKTIQGVRYELDLSEAIDFSLYFRGYYERETTKLLRRVVKPDMIVVEVGANVGAHTFKIAQLLSAGSGKLYSFEPSVYAFTKLRRNFTLNRFTNITLERIALSDVNEERRIHRASSQETMPFKASWDRRTHAAKQTSVDLIKFRRLDDYFDEQELHRLDLLKIDTDGYEFRVLQGARRIIERERPAIVIELGRAVERIGDSLEHVLDTIEQLGYSFRFVKTNAAVTKEELVTLLQNRQPMDFLCLPQAAPDSLRSPSVSDSVPFAA